MSNWFFIRASGFKGHACPESLKDGAVIDMSDRGGEEIRVEPRKTPVIIDLPGMCLTNRSYQEFDVDGLSLSIPSTDLSEFIEKLERSTVRSFTDGREYHKMHGWLVCVVMTVRQREKLLEAMREVAGRAAAEADEELRKLESAVRTINKDKVRIIRVTNPIPDGDPN